MLMKVFNKGQVVIPAAIRKQMDVQAGDMLDVRLDEKRRCIELKKTEPDTGSIAGSLCGYGKGKPFPTRRQMRNVLAKGMFRET